MTDVKLVKDCGLYPSYKKIIDFTGSKSEIISKQLNWINTFEHIDIFNANYNKFQNRLVLELDYEEALTYTYAVLQEITGTGIKPQFFFIQAVENLTNGIEDNGHSTPNVAITLSLDPIMTFMGEFSLDECMLNRGHVDRWDNGHIKRKTPNYEGVDAFNITKAVHDLQTEIPDVKIAICVLTFTSAYLRYKLEGTVSTEDKDTEMDKAIYQGVFLVDLDNPDTRLRTKVKFSAKDYEGGNPPALFIDYSYDGSIEFPSLNEIINGDFQSNAPVVDNAIISFTLSPVTLVDLDITTDTYGTCYNLKNYLPE